MGVGRMQSIAGRLHAHNDRGTGIAATELAYMAGAPPLALVRGHVSSCRSARCLRSRVRKSGRKTGNESV